MQLSHPTTPSGFRALSASWGMPPSDPTCLTLPADDKHGYCHCCSWCSFQDLESDTILCFLFHQLAAVGRSGNLLGKVWNCEDTVSDGTCVGVKISKTFLTSLNLHYPFGRLQMSHLNTGRGYRPPHSPVVLAIVIWVWQPPPWPAQLIPFLGIEITSQWCPSQEINPELCTDPVDGWWSSDWLT